MACTEAEHLRHEVAQCTTAYIEADGKRLEDDHGQDAMVADFAMYALNEAKRKYWFHVNQHRCESL